MKTVITLIIVSLLFSCSPFAKIKNYELIPINKNSSFTISTKGVDKNSRSTATTFLELFEINGKGVDSVQVSFESNRMILNYQYPFDKEPTQKIVVGTFEQNQFFQSVEIISNPEILNHKYQEIKRVGLRQDNELIVGITKKVKKGYWFALGASRSESTSYLFKSNKTRRRRVDETNLYKYQ